MIRMIATLALALAAFAGLSLRVARDADTRPASALPLAEVRTVDPSRGPALPDEEEARSADRSDRDRARARAVQVKPAVSARRKPRQPVAEEVLAAAAPFREGPASQSAAAAVAIPASNATDAAAQSVAPAPRGQDLLDQDEWAELIRRMLTLYRRTGSGG